MPGSHQPSGRPAASVLRARPCAGRDRADQATIRHLEGACSRRDAPRRGQLNHGPEGKGLIEQGSANLTDEIWLYGGTKAAIVESIRTGRGGQMPAWVGRLDEVTLKSLAVYVHSLGGGK